MRRRIQRWLFRVIEPLDMDPALWVWGTSLDERLRQTTTVGERIRVVRQTRGLTQHDVGERMHHPVQSIQVSDWERGKVMPAEPWVVDAAQALGIDPAWLFWGTSLDNALARAQTPGRRLTILRQVNGLSQGGLAEAVRASRASVGNWERDVHLPSPKYHAALARALGVPYRIVRDGSLAGSTQAPASPMAAADSWWAAILELLSDPARLTDGTIDRFASPQPKPDWLPELDRLYRFLYARYDSAGQIGHGYHRFEHDLEVAYLALQAAIAQGHEGETLLAVLLAGLLHDDDPERGAARPEVAHTLHHLETDADLDGFFDRLGLGQEGRWLVHQLIRGTEFPLDEATKGNIRLQIGTQRADLRWQADTEALVELFALADKAATYLLLTPEEAEERVRQLAHEQGKTESELVALTPFFFAQFLEAAPAFGWLLRRFPAYGLAWAAMQEHFAARREDIADAFDQAAQSAWAALELNTGDPLEAFSERLNPDLWRLLGEWVLDRPISRRRAAFETFVERFGLQAFRTLLARGLPLEPRGDTLGVALVPFHWLGPLGRRASEVFGRHLDWVRQGWADAGASSGAGVDRETLLAYPALVIAAGVAAALLSGGGIPAGLFTSLALSLGLIEIRAGHGHRLFRSTAADVDWDSVFFNARTTVGPARWAKEHGRALQAVVERVPEPVRARLQGVARTPAGSVEHLRRAVGFLRELDGHVRQGIEIREQLALLLLRSPDLGLLSLELVVLTINNATGKATETLQRTGDPAAAREAFLAALEPPVRRFLSAWLFERPLGERSVALQLLGRLLWIPQPALQRLQPLVGAGASAAPGAAEEGTIVAGTWLPLGELVRVAWHSVSWLRRVARRAGWTLSDGVFEVGLLRWGLPWDEAQRVDVSDWRSLLSAARRAAAGSEEPNRLALTREWLLGGLAQRWPVTAKRIERLARLPLPRRLLAFNWFVMRSDLAADLELQREFRDVFWGIQDLAADIEQALDAVFEAQLMRTVFPHEAFITALSDTARELIQGLVDVPAAERAFWLTVLVDTFELEEIAEPLR
ncbi:MAG TPA: helix-turn-helix transcriptional regulator, partial [archaeon]|nr:helix-turn-helix transcriptional regulator [archaeon]